MPPSIKWRVLQDLQDYYYNNMAKIPITNEESPHPLLHNDTCGFKALQVVKSSPEIQTY